MFKIRRWLDNGLIIIRLKTKRTVWEYRWKRKEKFIKTYYRKLGLLWALLWTLLVFPVQVWGLQMLLSSIK